MPKIRATNSADSDHNKQSSSDNPASKPMYDHSPNTLPAYFISLRKYLAAKDARYPTFWERGVVLNRGILCAFSNEHITALRNPPFTKGTFECPFDRSQYTPSAYSSAHSSPVLGPTSGTAGAPGTATPAATTATQSATTPATDQLEVRPEQCELLDGELFIDITDTWEDDDEVEAAEKTLGRSGLAVLKLLANDLIAAKADTSSLAYGTKVAADMDACEKAGIPHASVAAFNAFKRDMSAFRKILPDEAPVSDVLFAHKLATAVRKLGPNVAVRLDHKIDSTGAAGDLSKTKRAIISVLSTLEADDPQDMGRGLLGKGDPNRNGNDTKSTGNPNRREGDDKRPRHPDRPWDAARDNICKWCKILNQAGKHWNNDCRKKAEAKEVLKKSKEGGKGETGQGLLASGNLTDSESDHDQCQESDEEDQSSAGLSLFASSNLVDFEALDDPSQLLSAIETHGSAPTGGSAPSHGRGLMLRPPSISDSSDAHEPKPEPLDQQSLGSEAKSAPPTSNAPAHPLPAADATSKIDLAPGDARERNTVKPRFYVIPIGGPAVAGIYYGTWDTPHHLRSVVEGKSAPETVTSKRAISLEAAVSMCLSARPKPWSTIFRGPCLPGDHHDLAIGDDAAAHLGYDTHQQESTPIEPPGYADVKPRTAATTEQDTTYTAVAASIATDINACQTPAGLTLASHPDRVTLRRGLMVMYQLSAREQKLPPPGMLAMGADVSATNSPIKHKTISDFMLQQAGSAAQFADARRLYPARGSAPLRAAIAEVRKALTNILTTVAIDPKSEAEMAPHLAVTLVTDFTTTRRQAALSPGVVLMGRIVSSSTRDTIVDGGSFACRMLAYALTVAAGVAFAPVLRAEPGRLTPALLPIAVALLPVLLASAVLGLTHLILTRHQQRRPFTTRARGGGGSGCRTRMDGHLPLSTSRPPERERLSPLDSRRCKASAHRLHDLRSVAAPLLAIELTPTYVLGLPLQMLLIGLAAYLYLGGLALRCEHSPATTVYQMPTHRLAASAARTARHACLSAGGWAKLLRRTPIRLLHIAIILTTVACMGFSPETLHGGIAGKLEPERGHLTVQGRGGFWKETGRHKTDQRMSRSPTSKTELGTNGRALKATNNLGLNQKTIRALLSRETPSSPTSRTIRLILDSGCTMHCHPYENDLINRRPSNDTMSGIEGTKRKVKCVGDLPIVATDHRGKARELLIRGVRCVPGFTETLISVDRLWCDSQAEVRFADHRKIYVKDRKGRQHSFSFHRAPDRLYTWDVIGSRRAFTGKPPKLRGSRTPRATGLALLSEELPFDTSRYHRPTTASFLDTLNANDLASELHHRLHVSSSTISNLPKITADLPARVARLPGGTCTHCLEANAPRHTHASTDVYEPSYVGRLIHGDIVGPFKRSHTGGYQYGLVLTDDHSRFKTVLFLKRKSDALSEVRSYVAKLNAHLNRGRAEPIKVVGSLHTDNAGEFLSRDFHEFLNAESINQTTCPPYVHSLNGVAERAIRSIIENARSHMVASNCPTGFWPYAVRHAVEVLNRTSGPPKSDVSSYEIVHGKKPKLLPLLPFGCRVVVVKPRHSYSKTNLEPHGMSGINLGLDSSITKGYSIWIPGLSKVVSSSDVYYDGSFMPWRPRGSQRIGPVSMTHAPLDDIQPSSVHDLSTALEGSDVQAESVEEAFDLATRGVRVSARKSRKILILFSGPYTRPDGLAAYLNKFGYECTLVDNDPKKGNPKDNVLHNECYHELISRARAGEFLAIFAAPPCSTFSIARLLPSQDGSKGPPPVRDRVHPSGLPNVPVAHRSELLSANAIVARTAALLAAAWKAGSQFMVEQPVDRGDRAYPLHFLDERHAPLWLMPEIVALTKAVGAKQVHFPQCMFGASSQKRTTILYTGGFESWMEPLRRLVCNHLTHDKPAGGTKNSRGEWESSETAAYPPELNLYLAKSIDSLRINTLRAEPTPSVTKGAPAPTAVPADDGDQEPTLSAPKTDHKPPASKVRPASPIAAPSFDSTDDVPTPNIAPVADTDTPVDEGVIEVRDRRIWGDRAQRGSPIRKALRPRRALCLLGGALMALFHSNDHGRACLAQASQDPKTREEALRWDHDGWTASMDKEMENHRTNQSWEWIPADEVPTGRRLIKLIWVFKVKRDGKLKSRLCVQGCNQVAGVDYDQTFSAALRSPSLRTIASLSSRYGLRMHRWDFVSAYLQGELEEGEVVYCQPPKGYERQDESGRRLVCKVVKPIYGMAQAGRRWQRSLFPWLKDFGFEQSQHDPCVFYCNKTIQTPAGARQERLVVGVYVDDLCCAYSHADKHSLYHQFTEKLQEWNVEDEGVLHDLLNVEFTQSENRVELRQTGFITKLAETHLPEETSKAKSYDTPCDKSLETHVASALDSSDPVDPKLLKRYQSLVGALLYCSTHTRPDIAYAVNMLCRPFSKPTFDLLSDAERVLRYLHSTRHLGLTYEGSDRPLYGMTDSNWAVKHSTSGHVFVLNEAAISWSSKKQATIALSSCEAEIVAGSEASKEAISLSGLATELGLHDGSPVDLHMDNQSGINVAYNPEHQGRMKHVERRHFFIRECVEDHKIRVPFVETAKNLADFFTKPLEKGQFVALRNIIMNITAADSERVMDQTVK